MSKSNRVNQAVYWTGIPGVLSIQEIQQVRLQAPPMPTRMVSLSGLLVERPLKIKAEGDNKA